MGVALQLLQAGASGDKLAGTEFDLTEMQARLQVPPDEPTTAGIKTHSFQTTDRVRRPTLSRHDERGGDCCGEVRVQVAGVLGQSRGAIGRDLAFRQFRLGKQDSRQ